MDYREIIKKLFEINRSLRLDNGLYVASAGEHYRNYCWWRDIFYQSLPNLKNDPDKFVQTYRSFLDFLHKHEWKMDALINDPGSYNERTALQPRFYPNMEEAGEDWGSRQMDAFCLMLFGFCLGQESKLGILRNESDWNIIQKCIQMYEALEYWHLAGQDAWEEDCNIHSHAIGAALAAFRKLKQQGFDVDSVKLYWCECELNNLLPKESYEKEYDLAQLQLIWPLKVVSKGQRSQILSNVENNLLRDHGVIRYRGDKYFNIALKESKDMFGGLYMEEWEGFPNDNEMQWTFGLAYLAIIYNELGNKKAAKLCLDNIIESAGDNLEIPEGYYGFTKIKNPNTPLGWAVALTIQAIDGLGLIK